MADPNLTRIAAAERAEIITVDNYRIQLDLTDGAGRPGESTFRSTTTVTFAAAGREGAAAGTFIELIADTVHSATLNGEPVDVGGYNAEHGLALPSLAANNTLVVVADFRYSNTGEGLHRFVDPSDGAVYLYSQFETADAKRMFACFDQPDLKASFDVEVIAPNDWKVISNGADAAEPVPVGAASLHTFVTTKRISTYLVALIAGPYAVWEDEYSDSESTIPLRLFCRASLAEYMDAERLFTETKQGFGFYHKNFGFPYPFGKYDQLFVPEFNAGAMENAGAVTFLEDYVFRSKVTRYRYERRAETVLHEMAHMWFGDLVTMSWWDDLWLNESFATFASVLCQASATEYTSAWTTFANIEKSWAYRQDQLPSTHPVAADIPDIAAVEVNFDGITYAKGASVLKQLVAYVGLEDFLGGLRSYFVKHQFGNAGFSDLLAALEESSGRDLSQWGAQWLKTTGVNVLRPEFSVDADGNFTSFAIVQDGAAPGAGETRIHRIGVGIYSDVDGKLVRTNRVELDIEGPRTDVAELIGAARGDLVLLNDDDLSYCSIRLDPDSLAVLKARIGDFDDSLPRTLAWSAAWEMTRQAELRARDFVELVLGGIAAETEVGVVQRLLLQTSTAIGSYASPSWASETGWPRYAERLLELARAAEAGSDFQLAFINALAGAVLTKEQTDVFGALLDGVDPSVVGLPGLTVDVDLRWQLVAALAAAGVIDADSTATDRIDAELERDQTATGARQAATAAAARPSLAVKNESFDKVIGDDSIANITTRAICAGLVWNGQEDLLTTLTDRYFASIASVWERRSSEVAQTVVIGLYPSWDVSEAALGKADAFLEGDHPPALRRLVIEGRAGVERSLRARGFDGEGC